MEKEIKYLGVDWGESKIGLALGDSVVKIATPFKKVKTIEDIIEIIDEEEIDMIVLGRPVQISDNQLPISKQFEKFVFDLKEKTAVTIELIDERLTTKQADRLIRQGSQKEDQDALAAMLILQMYLDKNNE